MDDNIDIIQVVETYVEEEHRRRFSPLPNGKSYHVFLSYQDTDDDRPWVQELIEKLEKTYLLKCCNHVHDFKPGRKIVDNIKDAVISSVKTLIILSKEYHESYWCSYEAEYTHQMSMELREKIIIPVIKEDCEIPDHLKPFTYIDARGPIHEWLPRLVAAIEEPVNCVVDSKYSQLDFNTRYGNFDIVHVEKTKFRWCGCLKQLEFQSGLYIPDSLSSKVFNLTHDDYQRILRCVSYTDLAENRNSCLAWIPSILCCIIPSLVVLFFLFSSFVSNLIDISGNHTAIVLQRMETEKNRQWSTPIKQNITLAKIEKEPKNELNGNMFGLVVIVFFILVIMASLIICVVKMFCLKRSSIKSQLDIVNRILINHNLLAGVRFHCFTGTVEVVFIYFNHLPCLEALTEYVKITHKSNDDGASKANYIEFEIGIPSSSGGDDDDVPLLNVNMDDNDYNHQINDETSVQGEPVSNQQTENDLSNQTDDTDFASIAKDLLYQKAPDFVLEFLNERLEQTESGMHSTRVVCLCEYVRTQDEDLKKQSDKESSKLQRLRCCPVTKPAYLELIASPELPNANEDEISTV